MIDLLLQAAIPVNAMSDFTFTLGNLITIGGGAITTLTAFLKLQYDQKAEKEATRVRFETIEKEHQKEVSKLEDNILHITNGKRAMKKEIMTMMEKESEMVKARIDKTQERMEENKKENQAEFKEINGKLNQILGLLENKK